MWAGVKKKYVLWFYNQTSVLAYCDLPAKIEKEREKEMAWENKEIEILVNLYSRSPLPPYLHLLYILPLYIYICIYLADKLSSVAVTTTLLS